MDVKPSVANRGYSAMREEAMADFKVQHGVAAAG